MQADSKNEFRNRMHEAVANYEKAKESYERLGDIGKKPWIFRCNATIAFMNYRLASELPEKKRLVDECWQLTKETLKAFKDAENSSEYGKTYSQLSSSAYHVYDLEWKFQAREKTIKEAMIYGEQAVTMLSSVGDYDELAKAYTRTASFLSTLGWIFTPYLDVKMSHLHKGLGYWQKANELSERTALLELLSMSRAPESWSVDETLMAYQKALDYAKKTRDKLLIGTALDQLAYASFWKALRAEDPDKRLQMTEGALQYAEDANQQFLPICFTSPRGDTLWVGAPHTEYYWILALWETDPRKRHDLLEKAAKDGTEAIRLAENTGYPEIISTAHHVMSKVLVSLAQIEMNLKDKRKLLKKALEHRNESIKTTEQLAPLNYWVRGVMWNYLADLKAELSNIEKRFENKRTMLEEAISNKEICLHLCIKDSLNFEKIGELSYFVALAYYQYSYGELLNRIYALTSNVEQQRKAIKAFEQAAETYRKLNLFSYAAVCFWKAARCDDALCEHLSAAEKFVLASNSYQSAAEKIPQLRDFYRDHALYMQAWSEIEKARHHHRRQEYGLAEQNFEKAADIHKSLKQWSCLAPNYAAWASVEHAEELSRQDQSEKALQAFEQSTYLFEETKKSIQKGLAKIEDASEKQMATQVLTATDARREYCKARIEIEEAKILDKKGDHYGSFEKYGSAVETFQKIIQKVESEQDKKEFTLITTLSQAWARMTRAETEASPELYLEASKLFEKAKELSTNEKAKMLALGHSRFCRALETGTKFADTGNAKFHKNAIQQLESAAKYYVRAGFQNASEYAKATGLLLDAYGYMDHAKREADPDRKARLYTMAERVLQISANSFMKTEHAEKKWQVLALLKRVQEEREVAVSLTEVLHAPSIISSTKSFATPTPTSEEAVGLERFEHADVQAKVIARPKQLEVDENLDLEIELVNAGRVPALLTKITQVVPEGFQLAGKPEVYPVEDSYLNMKGKRLESLKTEEVRLFLRPKTPGVFSLRPTILYLDEEGKYRSHEPEPISIIVKEREIEGLHAPALRVQERAADRIATGYEDLDNMLLGGIPQKHAVILASPSYDEKDLLIKRFLETGAKKGEATFYVTIDPVEAKPLAEEFQSNFHLFICNPQADAIIKNLPNVSKLKGVENLTDISIALTSAIRQLDPELKNPKRICIGLISDVLLQHNAVQTRRWLTSLLTELKSTGFTILGVINPQMHPSQELQAIMDLFDGEISIFEKETERGPEKHLKVQKMSSHKYLEGELVLKKEQL